MEPIVTSYVALTEEEYVDFSLYVYRRRMRRNYAFAAIGALLLIGGGLMKSQWLWMGGVVLLAAGLVDIYYLRFWVKSRYRDPRNQNMRSPSRATIDDHQISFETESGMRSDIPWSNFIDMEEYKGSYLLYLGRYSPVTMVPRGQTPEEWERFTALVQDKKRGLGASSR